MLHHHSGTAVVDERRIAEGLEGLKGLRYREFKSLTTYGVVSAPIAEGHESRGKAGKTLFTRMERCTAGLAPTPAAQGASSTHGARRVVVHLSAQAVPTVGFDAGARFGVDVALYGVILGVGFGDRVVTMGTGGHRLLLQSARSVVRSNPDAIPWTTDPGRRYGR